MLTPSSILTVSEFNRLARTAIERQLPLTWISGEVSNLMRAASGHCYFSLKDANAQVRCVMFRQRVQTLAIRLENGQKIEVSALASLYEPRGEFQITVEALRQSGQGALYEAFIKLRERLTALGLFDRQRPLPRLPQRIGICTSPTAAALQDILSALERRAPQTQIIIYPTLVQGEAAPAQIIAALDAASRRNECDVLILARGGGSIEDLWAFNDEGVARAIAACAIPVVSGIGHETDVTIADMAADVRAATPTAAAELVSAGWLEITHRLRALQTGMSTAMRISLQRRMQAIDSLSHRLVHPRTALAKIAVQLQFTQHRLQQAATLCINHAQHRLQRLEALLAALNPTAILERGYCLAYDESGFLVRRAVTLQSGSAVRLQFARGNALAIVKTTNSD